MFFPEPTTSATFDKMVDPELDSDPDTELSSQREACLQSNIQEGVLAFNLLPEKMYRDSLYEFHVEINSIKKLEEVAKRFSTRLGKDIDTEIINPIGGDTTSAG